MQPRLICICGPNGAGKSTYTRTVATMENLLVIDPDKLAADGLSPIAAGKAAAKMARLFLENCVSFARVASRAARGGHSVPYEDVIRRFARSLENLPKAIALADKATILDNSTQGYRLIQVAK